MGYLLMYGGCEENINQAEDLLVIISVPLLCIELMLASFAYIVHFRHRDRASRSTSTGLRIQYDYLSTPPPSYESAVAADKR